MKAILSDIHGNLEALRAVLEDIARHDVEAIYCLGDVLGYGPNPCECLDLAMGWPVVLKGHFDRAVLHSAEGFSPPARRSVDWTRCQLRVPIVAPQVEARYLDFLARRPLKHEDLDDFLGDRLREGR
jgi:hypothetical protein